MKFIALFTFFILVGCAGHSNMPPEGPTLALAEGAESKTHTEAYGRKFMIATDGEAATKAGARMADLGGNSVDAAVAASFTISVERPHSTGLGGGGFFLLYLAKEKKTIAYDFREQAPKAASKNMFLDAKGDPREGESINGPLASGVPGLVAGLLEVHRRHGKLSLAQVMAPAIELAESGFVVYPALAEALLSRRETLARFPSTTKIFFGQDGAPLKAGDLLVQKDLAQTLRKISRRGHAGFYRGRVAKNIVKTSQELGGLITEKDLRSYEVKIRPPVKGKFLGFEIASMPPPSSGGVHVLEILNIIEKDNLNTLGQNSPQSIHLISSAMQRAFADRAEYLGDSDFVEVPVNALSSKKYAHGLRAQIDSVRAAPSSAVKPGQPALASEPDHTTHLNVMDGEGNAVSSTQTINGWMGSGVVAIDTGVVMNNEMDDFSIKPGTANLYGALGGEKNSIAPGKRPLSSMSPTILFQGGKPVLALGSPSGTRIISCVVQVILNRLLFDLPLLQSVASVRYHHQWWPDEIRVDKPGFAPSVRTNLEARGYKINESNLGCRVSAVEQRDGLLHGVADPRGEGVSLGN